MSATSCHVFESRRSPPSFTSEEGFTCKSVGRLWAVKTEKESLCRHFATEAEAIAWFAFSPEQAGKRSTGKLC
jgi:hypothetical protein